MFLKNISRNEHFCAGGVAQVWYSTYLASGGPWIQTQVQKTQNILRVEWYLTILDFL
jgi:hypothetical protein